MDDYFDPIYLFIDSLYSLIFKIADFALNTNHIKYYCFIFLNWKLYYVFFYCIDIILWSFTIQLTIYTSIKIN